MIAGGSESMSRAPLVMSKADRAFPTGTPEVADTVLGWRFVNARMKEMYPPITLGMTAEMVAEKYRITRDDQDGFALTSHQRAVAAQGTDRFKEEIEPIEAPVDHRRRGSVLVMEDEGPRSDTSLEALAALTPVFKEDGTVTAGNSSPMNDGAAALLLATETGLDRHGLVPIARIVSSAVAGVHPDYMGIGPVPSSRKALERAGIRTDALDLVELNEAFASQAVASLRALDLDSDKVNVNGGAIALGHPLGASGARILTTLVHELGKTRWSIRARHHVHRGRPGSGSRRRTGMSRPGPLDGIRVIEFGNLVAAPYCRDAPRRPGGGGSQGRAAERATWLAIGPFIHGESAFFMSINRGKASLAADAKNPLVADALRRLVLEADVLIHNLRPGAIERMGLGHLDLMTAAPRLVYAVISAFGTTGPWSRAGRNRSGVSGRVGDDGHFREPRATRPTRPPPPSPISLPGPMPPPRSAPLSWPDRPRARGAWWKCRFAMASWRCRRVGMPNSSLQGSSPVVPEPRPR